MTEKDIANIRAMHNAMPRATNFEMLAAYQMVRLLDMGAAGSTLGGRADMAAAANMKMNVGDRVAKLIVSWFDKPCADLAGIPPAIYLSAMGADDPVIHVALSQLSSIKADRVSRELSKVALTS